MLALLLRILGIQYTTLQSILGILGGILGILGILAFFFFGYTGIPLHPLADPELFSKAHIVLSLFFPTKTDSPVLKCPRLFIKG